MLARCLYCFRYIESLENECFADESIEGEGDEKEETLLGGGGERGNRFVVFEWLLDFAGREVSRPEPLHSLHGPWGGTPGSTSPIIHAGQW